MAKLDGKIALITGASSGSGLAIARRFVDEGATVFLAARDEKRLQSTVSTMGDAAIALPMDVSNPASVRSAFGQVRDRFNALDILINNAAVFRPCPVEELSDYDVLIQTQTNFIGPVYTCRAAIPLLRAAGGGDIINTSSESTGHPFPMLSVYVSTKAALEMLSKILAMEVRDDNIRVTTLIQGKAHGPGGGSTDWEWDHQYADRARQQWQNLGLLHEVDGRRIDQTVEDVADVHLFIATRPRNQQLDTVWCRSF